MRGSRAVGICRLWPPLQPSVAPGKLQGDAKRKEALGWFLDAAGYHCTRIKGSLSITGQSDHCGIAIRSQTISLCPHGHGGWIHGGGRHFFLARTFGGATGPFGAIIAWTIAAGGVYTLARVFQSLAGRKPDLEAGVYA